MSTRSDLPLWLEPLVSASASVVRSSLEETDRVWGEPFQHPRRGLGTALLVGLLHGEERALPADDLHAACVVAELYASTLYDPGGLDVETVRRALQSSSGGALLRKKMEMVRLIRYVLSRLPPILQESSPEGDLYIEGIITIAQALRSTPLDAEIRADLAAFGRRLEGGEGRIVGKDAFSLCLAACHPPAPGPRSFRLLEPITFSTRYVPTDPVERRMLEIVEPASSAVNDAAKRLLSAGGKRIRPRLLLALAGCPPPGWVIDAAARVEWLHQISLILDDIIDRSPVRRGQACLHEVVDTPYALAVVLELCRQVSHGILGPPSVTRSLGAAAFDLARGELLESLQPPTDAPSYLRMVTSKTASLFRLAGELGALAGGRSALEGAALGTDLGVAFQIVDDCLDLCGDEEIMGKQVLRDRSTDRWTMPFQELLHGLNPADQQILLGAPTAEWVREKVAEVGGLMDSRRYARGRMDAALAHLSEPAPRRVVVLAHSILDRVQ